MSKSSHTFTSKNTTCLLPVFPKEPAVKYEGLETFKKNHNSLLKKLRISQDHVVETIKYTLSFQENQERYRFTTSQVPEKTQSGQEQISFYYFPAREEGKENVTLIFSHGGKIHFDVIGSSAYIPVISTFVPSVSIVALNHRGTTSKEAMGCYSLQDRIKDLSIVLSFIKQEKIVSPNNKIIGFGDSMGGHVIAAATADITLFDGIILVEPAAYTKRAQYLPIRELHDAFPSIPRNKRTFTETISNYAPTDATSIKALSRFAELKKPVLLLYAENDARLRTKNLFTPNLYRDCIPLSNPLQSVVSYPGDHGDTTVKELKAIKKYLTSLQNL